MEVFVQKSFKSVLAGSMKPTKDNYGNKKTIATTFDGEVVEFWTDGAAKLWLEFNALVKA